MPPLQEKALKEELERERRDRAAEKERLIQEVLKRDI